MLAQLIRFSLVGVLNTALNYAVFYLLYRIGSPYLAASAIGFCVAVVNSYLLNKHWTFRHRGAHSGAEFMRFLLVSGTALGLNLAAMLVLVEAVAVTPPLAQLLTIGLTLAVNFLGNRLWTFR